MFDSIEQEAYRIFVAREAAAEASAKLDEIFQAKLRREAAINCRVAQLQHASWERKARNKARQEAILRKERTIQREIEARESAARIEIERTVAKEIANKLAWEKYYVDLNTYNRYIARKEIEKQLAQEKWDAEAPVRKKKEMEVIAILYFTFSVVFACCILPFLVF